MVSGFILLHWACVGTWLWPNPSDVKSFLLSIRVPLPARSEGKGWTLERQPLAAAYLVDTAQFQDWAMFAPNPLQFNRYVAATVILQDGRQEDYVFPRLSQLNGIQCWIQKRYRKYQHCIAETPAQSFRQDLARYIARQTRTADKRPVRVVIYEYRSEIPRHDRTREPGWIDYTAILRRHARYTRSLLLDYVLRPEDS